MLPLGTANDFARTLEIPSDIAAAVDTLLHGKVVEHGAARDVFAAPKSDYTRALLAAALTQTTATLSSSP